MNERIEKLANVWANIRAKDDRLGITYTFSEKALEQFAELILLDVRLLIADGRIENDNPVVDDVLVSVLISIEKHFGVEE